MSTAATFALTFFDQMEVIIGTRIDVTITEVATSEAAAGAIGLNAGTISAISTGVATAAPAELDAAIPAVPSPPPISLSAIISGIPVTIITATPNRIPNRPVCAITLRSMVLPSAKAKKGISVWTALLKNSRSSGSRLPSVKPTRKAALRRQTHAVQTTQSRPYRG